MTKRQDILLDATNQPAIADGDFAIGLSDDQHITLLLTTHKGHWKQWPQAGAGIERYLRKQNNNLADLKRDITVQLQADGYKPGSFNIDNSGEFKLQYEPAYEQ